MIRAIRVALILAGLAALALFLYSRRAHLAAKLWHWRHGSTTVLRGYAIDVPEDWLPAVDENEGTAILIDTQPANTADPTTVAGIVIVSIGGHPIQDLNDQISKVQNRLQREGLKQIEEQVIQLGDERLVCLGGSELHDILHAADAAIVSYECYSTGRLILSFTGSRKGLQEFYRIASSIRRQG